jgi:hypothetical protein
MSTKFRLARPSAHELLAADPPPSSYEEKRLRRVEKDAQRRKEPRFRLAHPSAHEVTRARTRPPSAHKLICYIAVSSWALASKFVGTSSWALC